MLGPADVIIFIYRIILQFELLSRRNIISESPKIGKNQGDKFEPYVMVVHNEFPHGVTPPMPHPPTLPSTPSPRPPYIA